MPRGLSHSSKLQLAHPAKPCTASTLQNATRKPNQALHLLLLLLGAACALRAVGQLLLLLLLVQRLLLLSTQRTSCRVFLTGKVVLQAQVHGLGTPSNARPWRQACCSCSP
jgi:hypothetical protein